MELSTLLPAVTAGRGWRNGRRCGGIESHCDDGDIIDGAAVERQGDQEIAGPLRPVFACQRKDLFVLYMSREAVAANHEDVSRLQYAAFDLKLRIIAYADGPRYDISAWPGARLLGGEPAFGNKFLHFCMIDRYLLDPVPANAVDAAVSGPYAGVMAIENKQNRDRGADYGAALVGELFETAVCVDNLLLAACQQSGCCHGNRDRVEFFDDDAARDLASFVAAHAVGHGPQTAPRRHKVIVLVLPPHFADMRCCAGLDP